MGIPWNEVLLLANMGPPNGQPVKSNELALTFRNVSYMKGFATLPDAREQFSGRRLGACLFPGWSRGAPVVCQHGIAKMRKIKLTLWAVFVVITCPRPARSRR